MFRHIAVRRFLVPLAVVVAMVLVVLPTVQMVGCDMNMGAMPFMPDGGAYTACPGQWVLTTGGTAGTVPGGAGSLTFLLALAVIAAGAVLFAPQASPRLVAEYTGDPPPPPEDSFGARFRV